MRHYESSDNGFIERHGGKEASGWINAECPDEAELHRLIDEIHVPQAFVNYLGDVDERPRVDREGDWNITILRIPARGHEQDVPYVTVPIGIMTKGELTVTLCFHPNDVIDDFVEYTRQRRVNVANRPDFILHMILTSATWYLKYLQNINRELTSTEHNMESSVRNKELLKLMRLQKTLVYFSTSLQGNDTMLEHLPHIYEGEYDTELLEDVDIEMKQATNTVTIYTQILESTMEALGSVISNNVNAVMKRMTAISIILMVPTLIASFYGMNVDIGLAGTPYAFGIIIVMALAATLGVLMWLKHIRWF